MKSSLIARYLSGLILISSLALPHQAIAATPDDGFRACVKLVKRVLKDSDLQSQAKAVLLCYFFKEWCEVAMGRDRCGFTIDSCKDTGDLGCIKTCTKKFGVNTQETETCLATCKQLNSALCDKIFPAG